MRIELLHHQDFIAELDADHEKVRGGIVRYRKDVRWEQAEQVSYELYVWLTAVVDLEEGAHLLECCEVYSGNDKGERAAGEVMEAVDKAAQRLGLEVRAGKAERY